MGKNSDFYYFSNVLKDILKFTPSGIVALSTALVLGACSDGKVAGGGPSGTEAGNAITAQIFAANATPAAKAKVTLMKADDIDSENSLEVSADNNGNVLFENIAEGNYTLEARFKDEALQQFVKITDNNVKLGKSLLKKTASVLGEGLAKNGTVKVRGLNHSAKVVDGKFTLDSLPEGPLSLVYIPASNGDTVSSYLKVQAGEKAIANSFANENSAIVLDDFEDLNSQHRLAPAYTDNGGWWYITSDSTVTVTFADSISYVPLEQVTLPNGEKNGRMHFTATFPEERVGYPWVSFGVQIGDKELADSIFPTYDLTSVDSITFEASGSGFFVFQLIDENLDESASVLGSFEIALSKETQTYSIPIANIVSKAEDLTHINLMAFQFTENAEFILDNIRLVGADKNSIWKR